MDGVGRDPSQVLVLGATNIPWQLDTAIRRRFQKRVHIGLPDTAARKKMFQLTIGATPAKLSNADYHQLAVKSDGYSGSDISIVVQDALMQPIRVIQNATHYKKVKVDGGKVKYTPCSPGDKGAIEMRWDSIEADELQEPLLTRSDLLKALKSTRASVSPDDIAQHNEWTKVYGTEG